MALVGNQVHETTLPPDVLYVNWDISELLNKPEGMVTEEELKRILGRYELRSGLILLARISSLIFHTRNKNRIGKTGYRDPSTGVFVTQFALAYLANILIASRSNDYKYKKQLSDRQNLLALCNLYSNGLIYPKIEREPGFIPTKEDILPLLVRMHTEQMDTQFNPVNLISRSLVIFTEVINEVAPSKFGNLSKVFEKETGLSITEYYFLVMAIISAAQATGTFRKEMLTEAAIPSMKALLTDAKVSAFLEILSTDYWSFRNEDLKLNTSLDPQDTKNRFNPLQLYPIIQTDIPSADPYVIPNMVWMLRRGFWGIYWWFHRHFEQTGKQQDFRTYFGAVFEEYTGGILKDIYGEKNVHPEINYPKGKFIDWWVKKLWKVYLFEVKAYQFPLNTKQTGEIDKLKEEIRRKVVGSIRQMYDRISEIKDYKELRIFKWRKIVPVIIFLEMPLISSDLYEELIASELDILEKAGRKGIKKMKVHLLNIEELELYESVSSKISLERVFKKYENKPSDGFLSVVQKVKGKEPMNNKYLGKKYNDFWQSMTGTNFNEETEKEILEEDFSLINGKRPA